MALTIDLTNCHAAPFWRNRCTACGHRKTINGVAPVQTREQPVWTWPIELIDRARARYAGRKQGVR